MQATYRRLPHVYPEGRKLFLTWCLDKAYPPRRMPPPGKMTPGQAFVWLDCFLDTTHTGPKYLKIPSVANLVETSLKHHDSVFRHYDLHAYVIMSNHVHALLTPRVPPSKLLHSLKLYTARQANTLLNRTGSPFWQHESYDHWVRNDVEFHRILAYIHNNPVKAGLVPTPESYRYSSAYAPQT